MTDGKKVMFVSMLGNDFNRAENMKALYDAYHGEKTCMVYCDPKFPDEIGSGKYSLMVIDSFPFFRSVKTIMIWHAIQGGKYIGLDQPAERLYWPRHLRNMDLIISAGHGGAKMLSRCTGMPEDRILNLGMPRTDRYIGKKKGDGGTVLAGKKAYFYAPTCRCKFEPQLPEIDWEKIDDGLNDDEILMVKAHPYGRQLNLSGYRHIVEAGKMEPSVNYLYDADVIITDYSSIIFDGYLLGKPAVLFEKERGYTYVRGMYMKYPEEYCSYYARNEDELLWMMRSTSITKRERDCISYVADACDGHSCERICKLIEEERQNG